MNQSRSLFKYLKNTRLFTGTKNLLIHILGFIRAVSSSISSKITELSKAENLIPGFKKKLVWVFIHALFLVIFTVALQYNAVVRFDESSFLKWATIVKHKVFNFDKKPDLNDVVFIDVAKDLALTMVCIVSYLSAGACTAHYLTSGHESPLRLGPGVRLNGEGA